VMYILLYFFIFFGFFHFFSEKSAEFLREFGVERKKTLSSFIIEDQLTTPIFRSRKV
jgi:hypothetical protein